MADSSAGAISGAIETENSNIAWRLTQSNLTLDDCDWYHTTELPDGTVIRGMWDLKGRESDYLGNVTLQGTTVFEPGPASGYFTYWMEGQGAEVTCFEAGYDAGFEYVPLSTAPTTRPGKRSS